MDFFADTYDNYLIKGDFNIERSDHSLKAFLNTNYLYNLIMSNTCFKGKSNTEPKLLNYRDFKHFSHEAFKEDLSEALCDCGNSYDDFDHIFTSKLNKQAPPQKS